MRSCLTIPLLVCCSLSPWASAWPKVSAPPPPTVGSPPACGGGKQPKKRTSSSSRWDRYLSRLYREADLNRDGSISFDECYERVLLFYVKLNRQAPIPPPSRAKILRLYAEADYDQSQSLDEEQFKELASTLASRGATRVLAHKLVTMVLGPWLATATVEYLATTESLGSVRQLLRGTAEGNLPGRLARLVETKSFWNTVVLILTVKNLGNLVMEGVNWYMDRNLTHD